jgi:hypothetical protein
MNRQLSLVPLALLFCLLSPVVSAQAEADPDSWWRASSETPNGTIETALRLHYVNGELFGTFRNSYLSAQLPIEDGQFSGNRLSFKLQLRTRLLHYEGEIDGDELTLSSRVIEGEPLEGSPEGSTITLTRSE